MNINTRKLRIKAKYLAAEARINRQEARKVRGMDRWDLNNHRQTVIRDEARATQLAYLYLRGKHRYRQIEAYVKDENHFACTIRPRVEKMVRKYGGELALARLSEWLSEPMALPTDRTARLQA